MPSGSKKRKAAKRKKKEEEMGIHHPPSPSPHSPTTTQGSSGVESDNSEAEMDRTEEFAYEVKEVGIEYLEEGNGTHVEQEVPVAEVPIREVVLEQAKSSLEEVEVSDAAASSATEDPPVSTDAEEQLPDVQRPEIATASATTEVTPAPLLEHRAMLWNCCGLLDAFKGTQR